MNQKSSLAREEAHLKNAASLLVYADGWLTDMEFRKNNGKIFYAVDTDIVNLFMSPLGRAKYTDIFEQEDGASGLLAWLLADFIFMERDGLKIDRPFYLVPPHDEELLRIAEAVHRKVLTQSDLIAVDMDEVTERFKNLLSADDAASSLKSAAGAAEWLRENAQGLIELFENRRRGPELELKRLAQLSREQVIQPLYGAVIPGMNQTFPCPDIENSLSDAVKFGEMKSRWLEKLRKHKPPRKPTYAIDGDAEVLARIEWANEAIEPNARLVLITGSEHIHKAAFEGNSDFAFSYVRHPRSFLADPNMFMLSLNDGEATVTDDFKVMEWLNLFFPRALKPSEGGGSVINRGFIKRFAQDRRLPEDFWKLLAQLKKVEDSTSLQDYVSEWGRHIEKLAAARKVHPNIFPDDETASNQLAEELLARIEGNKSDGIYAAIYDSSIKSLDQLYSAPAWIGIWETRKEKKESIKGVPELRFDHDEIAQLYANSVMKRLFDKDCRDVDLVKMYGDLASWDESNYLAHVIHALAYASKGHWLATISLARLAVAIRDCIPADDRGERRGREAAYLASVAVLRISEDVKGLKDAQVWLDQARFRDPGNCDLRFDSQALAIRRRKYFVEHFLDDTRPPKINELADACRELRELIKRIESDEKNIKVQAWLLRQCLTNLFLVGLLAGRSAEKVSCVDPEDCRSLLPKFDEVTSGRSEHSFSRHAYKYAFAMFGEDDNRRLIFALDVIRYKAQPLAPEIDKWRFELMADAMRVVHKQLASGLGITVNGKSLRELLSTREFEVLQLIKSGNRSKEIAEILAVNIHTINIYQAHIFNKLGVTNNDELVHFLNQQMERS
ncbi:MAG: helix-turn-helix transcriptional regulator [Gallionella sp.]